MDKRKAQCLGPLLVALLVTGCSGITPYEARDYREDGPKRGLLSGADGEFVIHIQTDALETDSETSKRSSQTEDKP